MAKSSNNSLDLESLGTLNASFQFQNDTTKLIVNFVSNGNCEIHFEDRDGPSSLTRNSEKGKYTQVKSSADGPGMIRINLRTWFWKDEDSSDSGEDIIDLVYQFELKDNCQTLVLNYLEVNYQLKRF